MKETGARVTAFRALAALAVAMGIGRFAFTPILPMMQEEASIGVVEGGWLASANYLGYLVGALAAMHGALKPRFAIRAGLLTIALTTLAMGFTSSFAAWLVLRALPGVASAWVLVHVSAWSLAGLEKASRPDLGGVVYAGVGSGIVFAGLVCLALGRAAFDYSDAWIALGIAAGLATVGLWRMTGSDVESATKNPGPLASPREIPEFWRLVFCHGALGLGYIIPATFLPVMAKQIVSDSLWFGWAWPVFGAAALASTLLAARTGRLMSYRSLWIRNPRDGGGRALSNCRDGPRGHRGRGSMRRRNIHGEHHGGPAGSTALGAREREGPHGGDDLRVCRGADRRAAPRERPDEVQERFLGGSGRCRDSARSCRLSALKQRRKP